MAKVESVIREVSRIIEAPYTVSLKALFDLIRRLDIEELRSWPLLKPCHPHGLAARICHDESNRPYLRPVLAILARVIEFRDALCEYSPGLLDEAFQKGCSLQKEVALGTTNSFYEKDGLEAIWSLQLGISMLSHPLPQSIALPASLPQFLETLTGRMIGQPSLETIQDVHKVICCVKSDAFAVLPVPILLDLAKICRTWIQRVDEHISSILCIALAAQFLKCDLHPSNASTMDSSPGGDHPITTPKWLETMTQVFSDQYLSKTLDLVFMRVILFCSGGGGFSKRQALQGIRLATEIVTTVNVEGHIERNHQKFAKLSTKAAAQTDADIRLETLSFCIVSGGGRFFGEKCRSLMQGSQFLMTLYRTSPEAFRLLSSESISKETQDLRPLESQHFLKELLLQFIDLCRPGQRDDARSASDLHLAIGICNNIDFAVETSQKLKDVVADIVSTDGIPDWWDLDPSIFMAQERGRERCNRQTFCPYSIAIARQELSKSLSSLLLRGGWQVSQNERSPQTVSALPRLINKLQQGPGLGCSLLDGETRKVPRLILQKDAPAEFETGISRRWPTQVTEALQDNAIASQRRVVDLMRAVCRDLEHRCETVEEPLRALETRYNEKEAELELLEEKGRSLEQEVLVVRRESAKLEDEKSKLLTNQRETQNLHDSLLAQVNEARRETEVWKQRCQANDIDLSNIREQTAAHSFQQSAALNELQETLSQEQDKSLVLTERIYKLQEDCQRLKEQSLDDHVQWNHSRQKFEDRLAKLDDVLEAQKTANKAQIQELNETYAVAMAKIESELNETRSNASREAASLQEGRSQLLKKIQHLKQERTALQHELHEAQDLKTKLAALMSGHGRDVYAVQSELPPTDGVSCDASVPDHFPGYGTAERMIAASPQPLDRLDGLGNLGHLRTPKSTIDHGRSYMKRDLLATRPWANSRATRRTLSSLSPNKGTIQSLITQSKLNEEAITEEQVSVHHRRICQEEEDPLATDSFDENTDLLTGTDKRKATSQMAEEETILTATDA